jgi:acylphosphatase
MRIRTQLMSEQNEPDNRTMTLRATIKGFVQGVGFRVFIRSHAWRLKLRGYVRNSADGTVEVVAAGPKHSLDLFVEEIWQGPAGAHVKHVDSQWQEGVAAGLAPHFEVRL